MRAINSCLLATRIPRSMLRAILLNKVSRMFMSRPSEKFLIEPSRKFLLTAARLKDGTNRDEPRGTGQAGVVEASQGQGDQPTEGGRKDGGERAVGAEAAAADEDGRGCSGDAWPAGTKVEPQDSQRDAGAGVGDFEAAGLARLRAHLCQ